MSFKITIINNEDGKVLVDEANAEAIIGAISTVETTGCLGFSNCAINTLAAALEGAKRAVREMEKRNPQVALLCACESFLGDEKKTKEESKEEKKAEPNIHEALEQIKQMTDGLKKLEELNNLLDSLKKQQGKKADEDNE